VTWDIVAVGKYLEANFKDSLDTGTGLDWGFSSPAIGPDMIKLVDSILGLPSELFLDNVKSSSLARPTLIYWFGSIPCIDEILSGKKIIVFLKRCLELSTNRLEKPTGANQ